MKNRSTRAKTTGTHRKACSQPSILSLEIVVRAYEKKKPRKVGERKKYNVCVTVQATHGEVQRTLKTFTPN